MSLPIHFFTIVLNGEPFIRHHIGQMKNLPFDWHWHIVEGVASHRHDTARSLRLGGNLPESMHKNGLSVDGTSEYLESLAREYPENISVYRPVPGQFWDGKVAMANAPLRRITDECLLWQVDADELWTADQWINGRQLFLDHPENMAAFFRCHYFVGPDLVLTMHPGFGNDPGCQWIRAWRYQPGMVMASFDPPQLFQHVSGETWRNVATINPFLHDQTEAAGLVFQHFALTEINQIRFKEAFYGWRGLENRWRAMQRDDQYPINVYDYLPWTDRDCRAVTAESLNIQPMISLPKPTENTWWQPSDSHPKRPCIAIDGLFYQFYATGIGKVWIELLRQWAGDGFGDHIVLLDRAGSAPEIPGIRRYLIGAIDDTAIERDRAQLQIICDDVGADVFISTYNSSVVTTPSVLLLHDMIPEICGWSMEDTAWVMKHHAIETARGIIAVSQSTKNDLLKVTPGYPQEKVIVVHNGVGERFHRRPSEESADLAARIGITRPYFLLVGVAAENKNHDLIFKALQKFPEAGKFDLLWTGGGALKPELAKVIPLDSRVISRWLKEDDLPAAYSGAVALLFPSRIEGFGMPIVEAMVCGCPIIAGDNPASREVGRDAPMYVSPDDPDVLADAMTKVLIPETRIAMIERGLRRAKDFSWKTAAQKISGILIAAGERSKA